MQAAQGVRAWPRRFVRSLAGRLLALTVLFVLIAEVLVFAPTLGGFYQNLLRDRVDAAQIAALAVEAAPAQEVTDTLERELLANAEVLLVALQRDGTRVLRLAQPLPENAGDRIEVADLRSITSFEAIAGGFASWLAPGDRVVRVLAQPRLESGEYIEVLVAKSTLQEDLDQYARTIIRSSLSISMLTGALVYFTLLFVLVYPMRRLTKHIERFRDRPEDVSRALRPSGRVDEIGRAEVALAAMEEQVRQSLRQRERLANLGSAVAKLTHDLRSGLATAQLLTERLGASPDPSVRQIAPRIERAIARSVALAQTALRYGKAQEPMPQLATVAMHGALEEAAAEALAPHPGILWRNAAAGDLAATVDPDNFHRILTNLIRNAAQAMEAAPHREGRGIVAATVTPVGDQVLIRLVDDGPGLPEKVKERLFEPFVSSSAGAEGAGLGLAIARELARGMGGDLRLARTGADGTAFDLVVPAALTSS